jgi:hypothetical protein
MGINDDLWGFNPSRSITVIVFLGTPTGDKKALWPSVGVC